MTLVSQFRSVLVPIILPALEENADHHWNPSVHTLTCNVRKQLQEMDEQLYSENLARYNEIRAERSRLEEERDRTWEQLELVAKSSMETR